MAGGHGGGWRKIFWWVGERFFKMHECQQTFYVNADTYV